MTSQSPRCDANIKFEWRWGTVAMERYWSRVQRNPNYYRCKRAATTEWRNYPVCAWHYRLAENKGMMP